MKDLRNGVHTLLQEVSRIIILPRFRNLHDDDVSTKSSATDFVTIADREAEDWLSHHLALLDDVPIIGEEACSDNADLRSQAGADRVWTVDPIDGTSNFVKGRPRFCTMIALVERGVATHSWIYQPLTGALYYAEQGGGAWVIDDATGTQTPLRARATANDPNLMIGSGNTLGVAEPRKAMVAERLRQLSGRRFPGSAGIQGVRIASGLEDYMMHGNCTPWDHSPVDLLCREAGAHAAMIDTGTAFHAGGTGPFMVTATESIWTNMAEMIWS